MGYTEVRHAESWEDGITNLINKLKELGFNAGQVYSIDCHNNAADGEAIISAHWHGEPVGGENNKCDIAFEMVNNEQAWDEHYKWADQRVQELRKEGKRVIALSHCNNTGDYGISVLFFEHHNPYQFL